MKKTVRILHIGLHTLEEEVARKMEQRGQNVSEMVRGWFREYGENHFPPDPLYAKVQKERLDLKKELVAEKLLFRKMAPEEYAETILKARVSKDAAWLTTISTQPYPIRLATVKEWTKDSDLVRNHLKIINGEEVFPSGSQTPMNEKARATAIKNWKKV